VQDRCVYVGGDGRNRSGEVVAGVRERRDIAARAEHPARPGQHDATDARVNVAGDCGFEQPARERGIDRVAALRAVERDPRDRAFDVEADGSAHACPRAVSRLIALARLQRCTSLGPS